MKRIVSLLLVTTTVVAFQGCGDLHKKDRQIKQKSELVNGQLNQATNAGIDSTMPEYTVTSVKYDDEYEFFNGSIKCISITDEAHSALADSVDDFFSDKIRAYNKKCERYVGESKEANKLLTKDKEKKQGTEDAYDYYIYYDYNINVEVTRCDSKIFSIKLTEYSYTGGAHGTTCETGYIFDSNTGELLSGLDEFSAVFQKEVLDYINNSPDSAKALLLDDYKATLEGYFESGLDSVGAWLDDRGITMAVKEADIAPYSAGVIHFTVPYSRLKDFDEDYLPTENFYSVNISTAGIADEIDVYGDGSEEVVYLEEIPSGNKLVGSTFNLHIGDKVIAADEKSDDVVFCTPVYVHSTVGNYFMLQVSYSNDAEKVFMYDVAKDYKLVGTADGDIVNVGDAQITLETYVDAFGTWPSDKDYSYDSKGFETRDTVDKLKNNPNDPDSNAKGITTKARIKYQKNGDEANIAELPKGTVIYPISTDGTELRFVTADGTSGSFKYETKDGIRYINGENEDMLFEDLPYEG